MIFLLVLLPATYTAGSAYKVAWGFFGHKLITEMAIYTLPADLMPFFKANKGIIVSKSVQPDQRRYVNPDEGPRHYIDLDLYEDIDSIPRFWPEAVSRYGEDTLQARGVGPWHTYFTFRNLVKAMSQKDGDKIIRIAADLSHYVADANVPLHTTSNYNGQLSNQVGIHSFWESRIPELFARDFDFWVGQAEYTMYPLSYIWDHVLYANSLTDSLFGLEYSLTNETGQHRKYVYEARSKKQVKVASKSFSRAYLNQFPFLEQQMQRSVKMIGDLWFTAWIEAGQPDLASIKDLPKVEEEPEVTPEKLVPAREHEY